VVEKSKTNIRQTEVYWKYSEFTGDKQSDGGDKQRKK
jgi:hypothetical protein